MIDDSETTSIAVDEKLPTSGWSRWKGRSGMREKTFRSLDQLISDLLAEYSQTPPAGGTWAPALSLRKDLSIDSLSLVSLTLRLGDELAVDMVDLGLDLGGLDTVADLISLGRSLIGHQQDRPIFQPNKGERRWPT